MQTLYRSAGSTLVAGSGPLRRNRSGSTVLSFMLLGFSTVIANHKLGVLFRDTCNFFVSDSVRTPFLVCSTATRQTTLSPFCSASAQQPELSTWHFQSSRSPVWTALCLSWRWNSLKLLLIQLPELTFFCSLSMRPKPLQLLQYMALCILIRLVLGILSRFILQCDCRWLFRLHRQQRMVLNGLGMIIGLCWAIHFNTLPCKTTNSWRNISSLTFRAVSA